jgi:hypothetical protein
MTINFTETGWSDYVYWEWQDKKLYFNGCGQPLACHKICPVGLPVEDLLVRSNAEAVW